MRLPSGPSCLPSLTATGALCLLHRRLLPFSQQAPLLPWAMLLCRLSSRQVQHRSLRLLRLLTQLTELLLLQLLNELLECVSRGVHQCCEGPEFVQKCGPSQGAQPRIRIRTGFHMLQRVICHFFASTFHFKVFCVVFHLGKSVLRRS